MASACVYGVGILAGAFLLFWAAEVAQLDISASLAIAILALLTMASASYRVDILAGAFSAFLGRRGGPAGHFGFPGNRDSGPPDHLTGVRH